MIKYYIQDDNHMFITRSSDESRGTYGLTSNKSLAEEFKNEEKAFNVLNCCLSADLRKRCHIVSVECEDDNMGRDLIASINDIDMEKFEERKSEMAEVTADMLSFLNAINDFIKNYDEINKRLSAELSTLDRKENDIRHYIEFNFSHLCAAKSYMVSKLQYNILAERRKIKNELQIIHAIHGFLNGSSDIHNTINIINSTLNPNYNVRELQDLFEDFKTNNI